MNAVAGDTVLKRLLRTVLPERTYYAGKRLLITRDARALRDQCRRDGTVAGIVASVMASQRFSPDQKPVEITALLTLLSKQPPRRLCEIGGRIGGSIAMFAQVAAADARLLSIDLEYKPGQVEGLTGLAGHGQQIRCVAADSHSAQTVQLVREWLAGGQLDFLFIDGDHSLAGVAADFSLYSPFVRRGGIIAFHDIVPDSKMRHGVESASYGGEVSLFWRGLKEQGFRTEEFVESWDQDGFGIGIIHWDGAAQGRQ